MDNLLVILEEYEEARKELSELGAREESVDICATMMACSAMFCRLYISANVMADTINHPPALEMIAMMLRDISAKH